MQRPRIPRGLVAIIALVVACADDARPTCEPPAESVYGCYPVDPSSPSCAGGPVWIDDEGTSHQDHPDLHFPDGCYVTVPDCAYGRPRQFQCVVYSERSGWGELL